MTRYRFIAFVLGLALATTGCVNLNRVLDPTSAARTATREASAAAGREVGKAVGQAIVRHYSPQFMNWYAGYLTRMAFSSQGYSVESATRGYEPGEYTEWAVRSPDDEAPTNRMRRAFLREEPDGKQWWQVVYHDNASDDTIVMESLFSADREQMLRMRAEFPDEEGPRELPVEEQNYQAPTRLTQESIDGASEGVERVQVPAGTFQAERIRFGNVGGTSQSWWLSDEVPGGVVRHATAVNDSSGDEEPDEAEQMPTENYVLELQDHGSGASSRLGIDD